MSVITTSPTEIMNKSTVLKFVVKNFSKTFQNCLTSTRILFNFDVIINGETTKWRLSLYPKGYIEEHKDSMSLILVNLSKNDVYIQTKISILNSKYEAECNASFPHYKSFQDGGYFCFPHFIQTKLLFVNKKDLLPEDKLTIFCKIFLDKTKSYCEKIRNGKIEEFDDFGMLYLNNKLSDVSILLKNGEKKIPAHKYILAKKSRVFAVMFEQDMLENRNNEVKITDISTLVIKMMICFIYTGQLAKVGVSTLLDLLKAADKYEINELKEKCEERISRKLSINNCSRIIEAADLFNADLLKFKLKQLNLS